MKDKKNKLHYFNIVIEFYQSWHLLLSEKKTRKSCMDENKALGKLN